MKIMLFLGLLLLSQMALAKDPDFKVVLQCENGLATLSITDREPIFYQLTIGNQNLDPKSKEAGVPQYLISSNSGQPVNSHFFQSVHMAGQYSVNGLHPQTPIVVKEVNELEVWLYPKGNEFNANSQAGHTVTVRQEGERLNIYLYNAYDNKNVADWSFRDCR
jgi:hypothetical protein